MRIGTHGVSYESAILDPPVVPRERIIPDSRRTAPRPPQRPVRRSRRRLPPWVDIAVPCAVAAALCLYELGTRSLWLDEGATVSIVSQHGDALWRGIAHDGGNMLVYYLFMHVVVGLFGDGAAVIRMPSVIATVATVGITGLIGRRLFDRRVAFVAALLTAVSLPLVFWGQDARGYAPLVTFCAGSFLAFIAIADAEDQPSWWLLGAYVLSTLLGVYMGFVGALVIPAQLMLLLFHNRHVMRRMLVASAVIAVACVPLLALATARGTSQLFWVPGPNARGIGQTMRWLTSAGLPPNFHPTATATLTLVVTVLVLAVALGLTLRRFVAAWRTRRFDSETWGTLIVLSWLVVPIALSLAESAAGQPILLFRNSVICLPAVGLALAWVLLRTRLPLWVAWSGVAGLLILRALQLGPSYGVSPENWKAAEHYVSSHVRPGDCIAFYPLDGRMPFDYYVRGGESANGTIATITSRVKVPRPVDPATPWGETPPYVEDYSTPTNAQLAHIERTCRRLWFVASHQGQAGGPPTSRANYVRYRVLGATLQVAYLHHHKQKFGWASPVQVELLSDPHPPKT
ncbi:MAG TPA: glycosyltransferase family 39 protein [Solirubrobacteraceae bacterium]|jgi:mannosyltransferase|nr:glycosyltransferase family 39 protein [Solirubrobacteraceae bacterium]